MEKNSKSGEILLISLLFALLFVNYLFLTKELSWEIHQFLEAKILVYINDKIKSFPRIVLIVFILVEILLNFKKLAKKFVLVLSTFVPASILFYFIDIFSDRIVAYLYPPLFGVIFFFYFFFKEPKDASISAEDLDADDYKLAREIKITNHSVNLVMHDGTEVGYLNMPNPFRGTIILGGAGSGKTFAVFEPMMFQFVMKDFVNFNYDYKFPDLTNQLQKFLDFREHAGKTNYPHYVINFTDPTRSHRCNPIQPANIEDTIELTSIATVFIQNIKKEWVKNKDFWADAAIAYLNATILYLYRNHPDKCTFPHVIELGCKPYGAILDMLLRDKECAKIMVSYAQAVKDKAGPQLAGMSGSLQVFLPNLSKPSIYWTLSGNDFSLEFNNPEHPHHISLGNDPGLRAQFLQPIIGVISKIALTKANRNYENLQKIKGKKTILKQIPTGLFFDELVTTYIEDLDQIPNTGRSNLLSLNIGIQMSPQLVDRYGQDKYKVLMGSFGNLFAGLVNDPDSAKIISEIFGSKKVKVKTESVSISHDGKESKSISYSFKDETAVPVGTLTSQPQGHFYGKYTVEFVKGKDLTVKEKKPFFKGYVLLDEVPSFDSISNPLDPMVPVKNKLANSYMIPEFSKFSSSDVYEEKQADMKVILQDNYDRIVKEVDDIIEAYKQKKELEEIAEQNQLGKVTNTPVSMDDYLKDIESTASVPPEVLDNSDFEQAEQAGNNIGQSYFAS